VLRPLAASFLLVAAASAASAGTDVQLSVAGLLSIRAADVTLREILDRVEDKTGMTTIYDGVPPPQLITVTLADLAPAVAVAQLLEGRGVRFAMSTDRVGARVVTLFLTTVQVEFKQLPSLFESPMPYVGESTNMDESTDDVPPWVPERPAWWPQPGETNAGVNADGVAVPMPGAEPPSAAPTAAAAATNLLPTPVPFAVSPFTPQGAGPIILALPGAAAPPADMPSSPVAVPTVPPPNPNYVN
jgi:hypothetical protein